MILAAVLKNKNFILPLILFLAVMAVFSKTLENDFIYDDWTKIVINRTLQTHINPVFYFTHPESDQPWTAYIPADVYRPLSTWFLAVEYRLFGPDPFYFHLVGNLLHSLNAVLFFIFLKRLFQNDYAALAGALIFGLHPVVSESAAWASQQGTLLSFFFIFLFFIIISSEKILRKWPVKTAAALLTALAAVFSKEQAIVLPILIAFFIWKARPSEKVGPSKFREITAASLAIIVYLISRTVFLGTFTQQAAWTSRYKMLLTMIHAFAHYLKLVFWPHPLSVNYDGFPISKSALDPTFVISAAAILAVLALAAVCLRKNWIVSFGLVWFFTGLLPVSNVIFPTKQVLNERFLYLSLTGIVLVVISSYLYLSEKLRTCAKTVKTLSIGLTAITLGLFSFLTYNRLADWKDDPALWRHELAVSPNTWRTQRNYGSALEWENRSEEAISYYENSLKIAPSADHLLNSAGPLIAAYGRIGQTDKAVETAGKYLEVNPDNDALLEISAQAYLTGKKYGLSAKIFESLAQKHGNDRLLFLAILAEKLNGAGPKLVAQKIALIKDEKFRNQIPMLLQGKIEAERKNWPAAEKKFNEALKIYAPPLPEAYLWLAESLEKTGQKEKAGLVYRLALNLNPLLVDAKQGIIRTE